VKLNDTIRFAGCTGVNLILLVPVIEEGQGGEDRAAFYAVSAAKSEFCEFSVFVLSFI
jgi:hypothetical protein